jgi:hypothetical protein
MLIYGYTYFTSSKTWHQMPHTTRIAIAIDSISIAHCPTIKSGNGPTQNACPSASKGMVHGTTLLQYQYYSYSSQL